MTQPQLTRQRVHHRLHEAYTALVSSITGLSEADLEAIPITPEWDALDILRHLSVWGELCARTLTNWRGPQNWTLGSAVLDDFNAEMVAARADRRLNEVMSTIMSAYQQYAATLLDCTDAELLERSRAPWDEELSRLELIYSILHHDLAHLHEIQQKLQQRG